MQYYPNNRNEILWKQEKALSVQRVSFAIHYFTWLNQLFIIGADFPRAHEI